MKSIYVFVVHRGGSTFLDHVFSDIADDAGMTRVNLGMLFYSNPQTPGTRYEGEAEGHVYSRIYTQYAEFIDLERIDRGICVLRDPRDVAVSMYYSHGFSHSLTPGESEATQ